jgi:hypothetical protein
MVNTRLTGFACYYCCRGLVKSGSILGGSDLSAAIKCFGALWIIGAVGRIITPVGMLYTSKWHVGDLVHL